ncbi:MAG: UDP-N-acetylmuramoyl-L-alanine--D-glutamate ligase [Fluviibacter sp.]
MTRCLISSQATPANLHGCRVLVVGLGESGLAMAKWLYQQQAQIAFVDTRIEPPGVQALLSNVPGAEWRCKGEALEAGAIDRCLVGVDLLALSPGVAFDHPLVLEAKAQGVSVWSEIDCFAVARAACCSKSKVIAITGANGKTTTTALTAHILNVAGIDAVACGNISPSALDAFMACEASGTWPQVWVLELSSFQLEATSHLHSDAAIILNLSEDHLDRHYTMAGYAAAKSRVFEDCAHPVWNRADIWAEAYGLDLNATPSIGDDMPLGSADFGLANGQLMLGQSAIIAQDHLPLLGRHNALNVQAALALATRVLPADKTLKDLLPGVCSFKSLPHRVSLVETLDGVRYVDDSKATNVGATLAAIDGLFDPANGKLLIVLGGEGKGQDFSPLAAPVARASRAVALIGKDAAEIARVLPVAVTVQRFNDLPSATRWLADQAQPGDTVLLSPACASLDMFRNYAERAQVFIDTVKTLTSCAPVKDGRAA